eukprot:4078326-Prymnesium_polylepis.1
MHGLTKLRPATRKSSSLGQRVRGVPLTMGETFRQFSEHLPRSVIEKIARKYGGICLPTCV